MIDFAKLGEERKLDKERFYLLIAGSRGFTMDGSMSYGTGESSAIIDNYIIFTGLVDRLLAKCKDKYKEIIIIHGDARGVDAMAKRYAKEHSYANKEYKADWVNDGRRAGMIRNQQMYNYLYLHPNRAVVLFWDGESRGTRNNFLHVNNGNIKVVCYNYMLQRWMTKEEIEEVTGEVVRESSRYI